MDPHVLGPLEREFTNSKRRQKEAEERVESLQVDLDAWQKEADEEKDIQRAINDALAQLGEAPLT